MSFPPSRHSTRRLLGAAGALSAAGALLVGLAALPASAKEKPTLVAERSAPGYGKILVTAQGYTLYLYTRDSPGVSACHGKCLEIWPPLLLAPGAASAKAGKGVHQRDLGTIKRPDLTDDPLQVTYDGHPLYLYLGDHDTKDLVTGQGVDGTWYVVGP